MERAEAELGPLKHLKIKFFLRIVNGFKLLTIVTKNSILDVAGVLALPSGQTVFTPPILKSTPLYPKFSPLLLILAIPYVSP